MKNEKMTRMKTMNEKIYLLLLLFLWATTDAKAQVTIGSTENPAASAILDLNTGGKNNLGLLLPRVALTSETDKITVASPATGLMVYADGTGGLTAGVYVWDGAKWKTTKSSDITVENPVTVFTLSPNPISVERWKTGTITASNFNSGATLPYVYWRVISGGSNLNGVTGMPTTLSFIANKVGTAVVRATSLDDTKSVDGIIDIWQTFVTEVAITNPNPLRLTIGNPAIALAADVYPENATRTTLIWRSANPAVASVSGSTVSGQTIGSTNLIASSTDDSGISDTITCIVYPVINNLSPITVNSGAPAQQLPVPATLPAGTFTWSDFSVSSNNPGVATVSPSGLLSFAGTGTATITVQFVNYPASAKTFTVTVRDCTGAPTGASIPGASRTINLNTTFTLTCNASTSGTTTYTWSSSAGGLSIYSGQGTSTVTIQGTGAGNWDASNITCTVANACGSVSASSSGTVKVSNCSGSPSGSIGSLTRTIAPNTTFYVSVSASGATSYSWSTPTGCSIVSGSGSATVTYRTPSYGTTVYGSSICCTLTNDCGLVTVCGSGTITVSNPAPTYEYGVYVVNSLVAQASVPAPSGGWQLINVSDLTTQERINLYNDSGITHINGLSIPTDYRVWYRTNTTWVYGKGALYCVWSVEPIDWLNSDGSTWSTTHCPTFPMSYLYRRAK
jgi:hypothetical protein